MLDRFVTDQTFQIPSPVEQTMLPPVRPTAHVPAPAKAATTPTPPSPPPPPLQEPIPPVVPQVDRAVPVTVSRVPAIASAAIHNAGAVAGGFKTRSVDSARAVSSFLLFPLCLLLSRSILTNTFH